MTIDKSLADVAKQHWQEFKANPSNEALRNKIVEHYLSIVHYQAKRVWARLPDGVDIDDLISAGVFGLVDAIKAFDLARGVKFETYCVPRIRGAMLDELRSNDWVPRLVRSKATKLAEAERNFVKTQGRPPTNEDLAQEMGVPLPELDKMQREANPVTLSSLDRTRYETDNHVAIREIDILDDKNGEDPTRRSQKRDLMRLVTKSLNQNERLIVILYYYEELTMKEIGNALNLSESRVSQMHSSIVQRLQAQLNERQLEFAA